MFSFLNCIFIDRNIEEIVVDSKNYQNTKISEAALEKCFFKKICSGNLENILRKHPQRSLILKKVKGCKFLTLPKNELLHRKCIRIAFKFQSILEF